MTNKLHFLFLGTVLVLCLSSCKKDLFNQEKYDEYVNFYFPIDNRDLDHDWKLTKSSTVSVTTTGDVQYVQVLTDNPYNSSNAEIAAHEICENHAATLRYTVPIGQTTLYLAALSSDKQYMGVVPFTYGTKTIDLTTEALQHSGTLTPPTLQTFSYLYEANFPVPDDFDYNDCVLRISKGYTDDPAQVLLTVKLEAVGSLKQIAGGIHLGGFNYDDILSVEIVEGERMDKDFPLPKNMIDSNDNLVKGRNGEAVINLFEDAHWALLREKTSIGSIPRQMLNTNKDESDLNSATVEPITTTYCITFKRRELAHRLTFENIDPFILDDYNGGTWEIHTYDYKLQDVLKEIFHGNTAAFDNHISWCITIPQRNVRYAIEGTALGSFKSETGIINGPYDDFVYWVQNHTNHTDWYLHPTRPQQLY